MSNNSQLPKEFFRIRLDLAREPGHPQGSRKIGYVFVAPLNHDGKINPDLWRQHREECRVVRFRARNEEVGHLVHSRGGAWAFHYDVRGDEDDETGFRFDNERFVIGEYVSIKEHDGMHTFMVSSVEHVS